MDRQGENRCSVFVGVQISEARSVGVFALIGFLNERDSSYGCNNV